MSICICFQIDSKNTEINRLQHLLADKANLEKFDNDENKNTSLVLQKEMHRLVSENGVLMKRIHQLETTLHEATSSEKLMKLRYDVSSSFRCIIIPT